MTTEAILEVLSFANGNLLPVRLVLRDGSEVVGVPSSVDTHVNSPTFGQVLNVRPMRSAQLNLRFRF